MPIQGFDYNDVGGGVDLGSAADSLLSKKMAALTNWYPYATSLKRRGGVSKLTTSAWNQHITSMFPLKLSTGAWALVVAGTGKFGKLDGSSIVDVPFASGAPVIGSSVVPWKMLQYKDYLYAMRRGSSALWRIKDVASPAGIAAPTVASVIAQGAVGALPAGTYRVVYTFGNRATNYESNPSPESNALVLGASRKIDHTAIAVSSDPFVDFRRVYRTLENQIAVYFFAFELSDNTTTLFTGEQVVVQDLGSTVSFNNGLPPENLEWGVIFNDRLFVTDGTDLFFSETLLAEMFGSDVLTVFPDDGHKIRVLYAFGDRLIIGKTNKVHYLVGTSRATFAIHTLSDAHGVKSGHSMQSAEGSLFWYGSGKAVFRSDGISVKDIGTPEVAPILENIPAEMEEYVIGAVFPEKNWYVLSVPQADEADASTNNRKVLVYNYKDDTWTVFTHPSDAPQFIGEFFTSNYGQILYSTFYDGHLYHYNDEDYGLDFGNPISASFTTRADAFGAHGFRKSFSEVWLLIPRVAGGTLRLEVLADELSAAVVDRTVSLDIANSGWKAYKLPTWTRPFTKGQMRGTYSGQTAVTLDQIHFDVDIMHRRPRQPA